MRVLVQHSIFQNRLFCFVFFPFLFKDILIYYFMFTSRSSFNDAHHFVVAILFFLQYYFLSICCCCQVRFHLYVRLLKQTIYDVILFIYFLRKRSSHQHFFRLFSFTSSSSFTQLKRTEQQQKVIQLNLKLLQQKKE